MDSLEVGQVYRVAHPQKGEFQIRVQKVGRRYVVGVLVGPDRARLAPPAFPLAPLVCVDSRSCRFTRVPQSTG